LDGFDAGAVVPLGSQQPLPAMRQAQPKLSIVFVMRVRGEFSALLDLVLEEIGCFDHAITTTKAPLTGAPIDQKRNKSVFVPKDQRPRGRPIERLAALGLRLTGDCTAENIQSAVGLADRRVYLRLTM
jgi:hypothetical protein